MNWSDIRVTVFRPPNRWQSLFERFEIDPHGPDAVAHMAARLAVELSAAAPEEFPEFAVEPPDYTTKRKDFAHWQLAHAMLDERERIDVERSKHGRTPRTVTVKEAAKSLLDAVTRHSTQHKGSDTCRLCWLKQSGCMEDIGNADSLKTTYYASTELGDCPLCVRHDREHGPFRVVFLDEHGQPRSCPMCAGKGKVRTPKLPGEMREEMALATLDPVGRAKDELAMLLALGPVVVPYAEIVADEDSAAE